MAVEVSETLFSNSSEFQQIDIFDTPEFGKMLFLDGHIQLAIRDEAAYHETLVHPAMWSIGNPTSALIIGGGDGGILREVAKHPSVQRIVMVEIDQMVIDACSEHLPELNNGAFQDPRLELLIEDAFAYIAAIDDQFDLIFIDATDIYEGEEGELSEQLFSGKFYSDCVSRLKPNGFLLTQCDNPVFCPYTLEQIKPQFQQYLAQVGDYFALVPSFGGYSAVLYGSPNNHITSKIPENHGMELRYLNQVNLNHSFSPRPFPWPN